MDSLARILRPESVAVIGASRDVDRISGRPVHLLRQHGFGGRIYPVNPKYDEIEGLRAYPRIADVPEPVDLAIVVTPARAVVDVVRQCAEAGVRAALVLSSGFGEAGEDGRVLEEELRGIRRTSAMRILGPNSEGFFNVTAGIPAGFSPAMDYERGLTVARRGPVGVVAQSGGMGFAVFNRGLDLGLGFSQVISTGNEVDLTLVDYLEHLVADPDTRIILAFVEGLRQAPRLKAVAEAAHAAEKPLIVAKVGRTEAGRRAARSHTGSLVGRDVVYEAAFRQWGVLRADDLDDLLDWAMFFSINRRPVHGRRVAVLTASGGGGVWLSDWLVASGLEVPELEPAVRERLGTFVPPYGSTVNPVDLTAQAASGGGLERALEVLGQSERVDAVAMIMPLAPEERTVARGPGLKAALGAHHKPVVNFSYRLPTPRAAAVMEELGIPSFPSPARTARALAAAARWHTWRPAAGVSPAADAPTLPPGPWTEAVVKAALGRAGIPVTREILARSADEAVAAAEALGYPVAVKVQSSALAHKSDIGGVRLRLQDAEAVRRAWTAVMEAAAKARPDVPLDGVLVQEMVPDGVEVIVGTTVDPDFGPVVMVGLGGVFAEALADVAVRVAPVDAATAREMLGGLRGRALLEGARGRPAADVEALAAVVARISAVAAAWSDTVAQLDLNPVMVHPRGQGAVVVDAWAVPTEKGA
ncbi:MAG: acetate--CoA ligase family protein [Actinomycetia bacterium]|nr:acetate--CoA ligase family protein [Actinomycetes bacterium]